MSKNSIRNIPQQSRSQERVNLILDTAADLFAEVGYETATTNAIAERAGVSIGSLYRYFPDKDAILKALVERYYAQESLLFEKVFVEDMKYLPLEVVLDRLIDPFLDLSYCFPAYAHILLGSDVSADIAAASCKLEQELIQRMADFFCLVMPELSKERSYLVAMVSKAVVKALIALLGTSKDEAYRVQVTAEVKRMLLGYFKDLFPPQG